MTDQFDLCMTAYKTQLLTLAETYFPAGIDKAAGWQISEVDATPQSGGNYFITLRPGTFSRNRNEDFQMNDWHITTVLYMRYAEQGDIWPVFRTFRSAVIGLPDTAKIRSNGIYDQDFSAREDPGFLLNSQGQYTNFVVQSLDCSIKQRVHLRRI